MGNPPKGAAGAGSGHKKWTKARVGCTKKWYRGLKPGITCSRGLPLVAECRIVAAEVVWEIVALNGDKRQEAPWKDPGGSLPGPGLV